MRNRLKFQAGSFFVFALVACMFSCHAPKGETIEQVAVYRYEVDVMQMDTASIQAELERLALAYPLFFEGADVTDSLNIEQIKLFMEDPVVRQLYGFVVEQYGKDSLQLSREFGLLFGKAKAMCPGIRIPEVYTYLAYPYFQDHASRVIYMDSVMVLGLDFYIKGNQYLMDKAGIPRYMSRRFSPDYLMPDAARILAVAAFGERDCKSLLDHIVQEGKVVYLMRRLLPDVSMPVLLGYTDEQMAWCEENESLVWNYLIQQDLLFSSDPFAYRYFVNDGPFNPMLPGAPARPSWFVGWKMVESYMDRKDTDMEGLSRADSRTVLEISRYKP